MEADFSGYATKAGLKCSDGRTIMPDAFKHQDTMTVPLVWQHGHKDLENVLGHVRLENRSDGVYAYGFFNDSKQAEHAKKAVGHKDITMMSIWANDLIERAGRVLHGAIREVSLVLSGANPGALIDNITIRHGDSVEDVLEDEAIIYTGLNFDHSEPFEVEDKNDKNDDKNDNVDDKNDDDNVESFLASLSDEQKVKVMHSMIDGTITHATPDGEETIQDVYDSMTDKQKEVLHFMVGEALQSANENGGTAAQSNLNDDVDDNDKKGQEMKHNVFEDDKNKDGGETVLSHADVQGIIADATRSGSLKDAVENYAIKHGINDIDILFPDAVAVDKVPEFLQRRVEWVGTFLGAVRKSPFSRIKTLSADITFDEARAKGYVKGSLKKEEFFGVARRVTTPTTIYKKQTLDRDDIVDITDFDVVAWLKSEMRLMLDEELARAALFGDGRDVASEDKIPETNIRPIAKEHELFCTTININLDDANSSISELVDAIVANRKYYKGTGQPTMYTTETIISRFLLLRDTLGRRIYNTLTDVASELRVSAIVPVEAMEDEEDLVAIIVNPVDYVIGATRGGEVNLFDDFDIDYNKNKYLIETRCSGALTRLKSALVVRKVASTDVLIVPAAPTFDPETGALTINDTSHVTYKRTDTDATVTNSGSPYTIASGTSVTIQATAASGYYFATTEDDSWTFTAE